MKQQHSQDGSYNATLTNIECSNENQTLVRNQGPDYTNIECTNPF